MSNVDRGLLLSRPRVPGEGRRGLTASRVFGEVFKGIESEGAMEVASPDAGEIVKVLDQRLCDPRLSRRRWRRYRPRSTGNPAFFHPREVEEEHGRRPSAADEPGEEREASACHVLLVLEQRACKAVE